MLLHCRSNAWEPTGHGLRRGEAIVLRKLLRVVIAVLVSAEDLPQRFHRTPPCLGYRREIRSLHQTAIWIESEEVMPEVENPAEHYSACRSSTGR